MLSEYRSFSIKITLFLQRQVGSIIEEITKGGKWVIMCVIKHELFPFDNYSNCFTDQQKVKFSYVHTLQKAVMKRKNL